ncbi:MAG: RNA 2',3'-cyclic phosphodiesterase [Candidatus Pacearchaeota archaeon]
MNEEKNEKTKLTRAFIAIEFSDECVKEIARVQGLLEKIKFQGKLTELENLHLTLKFLGEIDDEKLKEAREKLKEIEFSPMKLKLGKIGTFNYKGNPRIVWIKVEGKAIYDLQKKIDLALKDAGFKSEERFMGHLTIARIKYVKDKKEFDKHIKSIHVKPIAFSVGEFKLKKSELKPVGPSYMDLEIYSASE